MADLNDIALFVQVVQCGSFSEAGRRLGIPPNTVSRRIQQLETQLGTRLMQRSTRKLTLTDAGSVFHNRCAAAVAGLEQASQDLAVGSQTPSGLVRVAAPANFFDFYEIEWIAAFLEAYPLVRLDFVLDDAPADLITQRIDVAFRGSPVRESTYVTRRLLVTTSGLFASPDYLAARGTPAKLNDLTQHDCVIWPHPSGQVTWRLQGPDGFEEEVDVTGRFIANTLQALRRATLAGLGIALLPGITISDIAENRLVPVLPQYKRPGTGMSLVYPSRRQLPMAVSAFVASVEKNLSTAFASYKL